MGVDIIVHNMTLGQTYIGRRYKFFREECLYESMPWWCPTDYIIGDIDCFPTGRIFDITSPTEDYRKGFSTFTVINDFHCLFNRKLEFSICYSSDLSSESIFKIMLWKKADCIVFDSEYHTIKKDYTLNPPFVPKDDLSSYTRLMLI